ncbi:hypothetical protein J45TS6_24650 [Paenibacillus sp. J45TS6]|uniref:hypothetical protein n=1 Tax=Paenibacillus sp. J45TS6 TaxID=2807196 RepID=UPI001B19FAD4|nr:hypothetical protein [Paenibacillus sp. J45TS6]GIP44006.1 hypothetical protein J45TS6_24650 [Paenibacillus sp. J45TS6]
MSKKSYIIVFIILLGVITMIYTRVYKDAEIKNNQKHELLMSLYKEKDDTAFLYILEHTVSSIPLADTLESISNTKKNERPANVQQFIETAKIQATEIDEQLFLLIKFSGYNDKFIEEYMNTGGETDTKSDDPDLSFLTHRLTWNPIRTISYGYWKSNPKLDDRTREYLLSLAGELRSMNEKLSESKEMATSMASSSNYPSNVKRYLLKEIQPFILNIDKLNQDFYSDLRIAG